MTGLHSGTRRFLAALAAVVWAGAVFGQVPDLTKTIDFEREGEFHAIPRGLDTIEAGDKLVLYGTKGSAENLFRPESSELFKLVESSNGAGESTRENVDPRAVPDADE